jgi:hypothetical protein
MEEAVALAARNDKRAKARDRKRLSRKKQKDREVILQFPLLPSICFIS